jgi:WD40-like Beta Propeller Repeat
MRRVCLPLLIRLVVFAVLASLPFARIASAQVFGKNKVQYEPLDWSVLETPHVRFHYYAEEESLGRRLAAVAESVCVEYDERYRLTFRQPIPILLFSSHHYFQQTNATPGLISEATGGLTELVKGRVLIPHNGSWARLVWVTRHELAHAYMLEKLARVMKDHKRSQGYLPPLWFIEGLAEYFGTKWDADAEGLLRDAMLTGRAVRLTRSESITGTVLMYKEGQSFLLWLDETYGHDKVVDLMDNWWRADDFETAFRITFGERLETLDDRWFELIRRRYYPVVAIAQNASETGERLTHHGHYNLGPRVLPPKIAEPPALRDTTLRFCYFEADEGGIDLMINEPTKDGRRRDRRVLRGGQSPQFESFHLFQNRPDALPSGLIALSSKRGGRDAIYLVDGAHHRVLRRMEFPDLIAINDPSLTPDGSSVVFSAQDEGGRSDLYRASWHEGKVRTERLTNDDFDDIEPDVSPDGKWVVFSSDRASLGNPNRLFRLSLSDAHIEPMSQPASGEDRQPAYSPDGRWIAFRSTRGGTSDLYVRPAEPSPEVRRVTRLLGPASDPDWLPDGRGLLYAAQERVEFQIYRKEFVPDTLPTEPETPIATPPPLLVDVVDSASNQRYQRRLGLDLIQNGIAVDPSFGGIGGGQVALSDILGNEQFYISITNDSERFGNFWDGFEGGITYINQAQRLNYGVGIFRLTQIYDADLDVVRRERRLGLLGLASYPFNKFTRIEGSLLIRHANDHLLRNGEFKTVDLLSNFLSLVHDNTGWTYLGPSNGSRWLLSAGFTRDLTSGAGDFATLIGELRHYEQPIPMLVSATRIQAQSSLGNDAQRFYLGGRSALRGYNRRELSGLYTALIQQEFRMPLLRGLVMALPAPWMFPPVSAAAFSDVAWGWDDNLYRTPRHLASVGTGFYIGGGYYPVFRWNFVWTTPDFQTFSVRPRTEFLIGFNY